MAETKQWFTFIDAMGVSRDGEVFVPKVTVLPLDDEETPPNDETTESSTDEDEDPAH